jgi:FtsP/CotA-like multicopper oxidase with cupredoxin domain
MADGQAVKSKMLTVVESEESFSVLTSDSAASRREFLGFALTAASGLALAQLFPWRVTAQQAGVLCAAKPGAELTNPGEIKSAKGLLQGLIDLQVETRNITYYNNGIYACDKHTLRAYQGYQGFNMDPRNRVTLVGIASPGPTLRAAVGDRVELIFLNRIERADFNQTSVTSSFGKCDTTSNISGGGGYPGKDVFPNCFHASNTTNLHFHGTHVSPGGFGDNVLIGVVADPKMNAAAVITECAAAYAAWAMHKDNPMHKDPTQALQESARLRLDALLKAAQKAGNKELADQLQSAVNVNDNDRKANEWPQYWPGFYPHYFQLPVWSGDLKKSPMMGQSPGTHWYHCHQHGSTSLQILNGMAGVFIITGDYDDKLLRLGGGTPEQPKIKEQVMIFQLFAEQPNQVNASPTSNTLAVNGQVLPTVTMKKGEVQWWRIANAAMRAHGIEQYLFLNEAAYADLIANPGKMKDKNGGTAPPPAIDPSTVPSFNQTAQDGVQFHWENYLRLAKTSSFEASPGNRVDFLVQAPTASSSAYLVFWPPIGGPPPPPIKDIRANTILKVVTDGDPAGVNTQLPTASQYPALPGFLADITDAEVNGHKRTVTFSMKGKIGGQPQFFIDGKQFSEGTLDQVMLMGSAEEWTIVNTSLFNIMHPFHIHINPFQVTEIYNPGTMQAPMSLPQPWIWWDTIAIPAGVQKKDYAGNLLTDAAGNPVVTPGYLKMRTRFVDFFGKYVLHCHILGHEDRGMMQMVEVVSNHTAVTHH